MNALDLFAGPGGWDVAARELGIDPLGIELDADACATREAAGHRTLRADIAALEPLDFAPCDLLIASPPCQAWSLAGNQGGKRDLERVYELTDRIAGGLGRFTLKTHANTRAGQRGYRPEGYARTGDAPAPTVDSAARGWTLDPDELGEWEDRRSALVTEPLRWALALRPRYIALEQVPPVLDYWRHIAEILRREGYGVWTGILEAERYGVPQTRERAILVADADGHPQPPAPTHQRYIPGEPARHDITLEGEILPWVSMAEALGWGNIGEVLAGDRVQAGGGNVPRPTAEPAATLGQRTDLWRRDEPSVQTNNFTAKQRDLDGRRTKRGSVPYERDLEAPAPTVDTSAGGWQLRAGTNANDISRPGDEPAPTIRYGERANDVSWVGAFDPNAGRGAGMIKRGGQREPTEVTKPAPTITTHARDARWKDVDVPAPTVCAGGTDTGGAEVFGRGGRDRIANARLEAGTPRRGDAKRTTGEPAPTVKSGGDAARMVFRNGHQPNAAARAADEPAPTIIGGHDTANRQWTEEQPAPTVTGSRRSDRGIVVGRQLPEGEGRNVGGHDWKDGAPTHLDTRQSHAQARPLDRLSPAMVGQNLAKAAAVWTDDPATETTEGTGYKPTKGVRVTEREAAILQGFSPDYPWQGARTRQFQQIGNAIPPPLARVILIELIG